MRYSTHWPTVSLLILLSCFVISIFTICCKANEKKVLTPSKNQEVTKAPVSPILEKKEFISEDWKRANKLERVTFYENIIISKILIGKTKEEVFELLGPCDGTDRDSIYYSIDSGQKLESGSPWFFSLNIYFDSKGLVTAVRGST